jgi:putrescine aminotransferase
MSTPVQPFSSRADTLEAFGRHVSHGKVAFFEKYGLDVVMGEREGAGFRDAFDERTWIDVHCNGGVFNLGHRHPAVVAALRRALDSLDVGNHHLISGLRAALAQRLAASTGGALSGVVFGSSGGESIDLALKLARGVTGRQKLISAAGGYHGHTGLALAAGDPQYREPFGIDLPDFVQVPFDDLPALEAVLGEDTAAVILEPIPATLGMPLPSPGYLARVAQLCRERGAKLILDEVQTGLGRTGRFWAYQHHDLTPDLVVTGKGLSGGLYPITACLMRPEVHAFFDERPFVHVSTFGGAELGCAVALATLDVLEAPGFLERVSAVSERIGEGLRGLPFELRRCGLMMGIKLSSPGFGLFAAKFLYDAGVFAAYANNDTSVVQVLPPLTITDAEVTTLLERLHAVFA